MAFMSFTENLVAAVAFIVFTALGSAVAGYSGGVVGAIVGLLATFAFVVVTRRNKASGR